MAWHSIDKHLLIEMVRRNPVLWDCRLPHQNLSDKEMITNKWNELGRFFRVSGNRVHCIFTSLRETFRRELTHKKWLGSRFKSKWMYYEEMKFLMYSTGERKIRGGGGVTVTIPVEIIDLDHVYDDSEMEADNLDDDADDTMRPAAAADGRLPVAPSRGRPESHRELLYSTFGDFVAARLNILTEATATNTMNNIIQLIAEN